MLSEQLLLLYMAGETRGKWLPWKWTLHIFKRYMTSYQHGIGITTWSRLVYILPAAALPLPKPNTLVGWKTTVSMIEPCKCPKLKRGLEMSMTLVSSQSTSRSSIVIHQACQRRWMCGPFGSTIAPALSSEEVGWGLDYQWFRSELRKDIPGSLGVIAPSLAIILSLSHSPRSKFPSAQAFCQNPLIVIAGAALVRCRFLPSGEHAAGESAGRRWEECVQQGRREEERMWGGHWRCGCRGRWRAAGTSAVMGWRGDWRGW